MHAPSRPLTFAQRLPLLLGAAMAFLALVALGARAPAQGQRNADQPMAPTPRATSYAALHMELTPRRAGDAADSARAAGIARTLRAALAPFRDTTAAVKAGYRMFAPHLKEQRVYHFTSSWRAVQEGFRFDARRPTSLLYTRGADGTFSLVGAMYTAPKRFGPEELDARIPLGVAQWHRHVNWCVPRAGARERWLERRDGAPVFGPESPIATRDACEAARGTFHESVFGWMVHATVFAGEDAASIWGDEHAAHGMHEPLKAESRAIPKS